MIIGITGKTGSGKNYYIENVLMQKYPDALHIDFDLVNHDVLRLPQVIEKLVEIFGATILDANGEISRRALGARAFNNDNLYKALMDITKGPFEEIIDGLIAREDIVILNWALLPRTKYWARCDQKILIDRPMAVRLTSAIARDGITPAQFAAREQRGIEYNIEEMDLVIE